GLGHLAAPVSDVRHDRAARGVEDGPAVLGVEPRALGARDAQGRGARARREGKAARALGVHQASPTSLALSSHGFWATPVSRAARSGAFSRPETKYFPVSFATAGSLASCTLVRAPFSGLAPTSFMPVRISQDASRAISVATPPGWSEFEVT